MKNADFISFLEKNNIPYEKNVPMSAHTTFKIGGAAEYFITPNTQNELVAVIGAAKQNGINCFILGNGSNLLVSDNGIDGAVISTLNISEISVSGNILTCGAGASVRTVCLAARDNSLSGLEFAYGIPGSMGGAFYMNAGAYGGEIKDVALEATCLTENGDIVNIAAADMALGYRTSIFKTKELIILSVKLKLNLGDRDKINDAMNDYFSRRTDKQPLDYPSAGSTFKRPEGYFAGALIEQNGFKGFSVGGAAVSEKHAGFIINKGNATACEVKELIKTIKEKVKKNDGVTLETEVIFVGKE